jgi:hypothetical protein
VHRADDYPVLSSLFYVLISTATFTFISSHSILLPPMRHTAVGLSPCYIFTFSRFGLLLKLGFFGPHPVSLGLGNAPHADMILTCFIRTPAVLTTYLSRSTLILMWSCASLLSLEHGLPTPLDLTFSSVCADHDRAFEFSSFTSLICPWSYYTIDELSPSYLSVYFPSLHVHLYPSYYSHPTHRNTHGPSHNHSPSPSPL